MREGKQSPGFVVDDEYVELAAEVFRLLSDATRIRIILALSVGEMFVGDLAERVGKSPTVVSQHLAKLRWARVVAARQDGNRSFYRLTDEHAGNLVAQAVFQAEHAVDEEPRHHRAAGGATVSSAAARDGAAS